MQRAMEEFGKRITAQTGFMAERQAPGKTGATAENPICFHLTRWSFFCDSLLLAWEGGPVAG